MKQSLTKLLVKPVIKDEQVDAQDKSQVDEEYEEIFKTMETVSDVPKKLKKRKKSEAGDGIKKKKKKKIVAA